MTMPSVLCTTTHAALAAVMTEQQAAMMFRMLTVSTIDPVFW
jgi:hypothetical protein